MPTQGFYLAVNKLITRVTKNIFFFPCENDCVIQLNINHLFLFSKVVTSFAI